MITSTTPNLREILTHFENIEGGDGRFTARCPSHDDKRNSLSISQGEDGRVLFHCHAGCGFHEIVKAAGLDGVDLGTLKSGRREEVKRPATPGQLVATYNYVDEHGEVLFQALRYDPKNFRQRRPDGNGGWVWKLDGVRQVPYRLPSIIAADPSEVVYICEGEKDVDRLAALGLVATCNAGGAGKWRAEFAEHFVGRRVAILADNDDAGRKHAEDVAVKLRGVVASVKVVELPGLPIKGDVSDWLDAGGTKEELIKLATSLWLAEIDRDTKNNFRVKLSLPASESSVILKAEDVADTRRVRSAIFQQTGRYLSEGDSAQLFRLLPGLMEKAERQYIEDCKAAGVNPYAEAIPEPIEFISAKQLAERSASIEYAVDGILVAGQPAIIGGPKKILKTTIAINFAASLATGSKFLGEFDVLQRGRVGFISAESGEATIRETASRICTQMGYGLSNVDILFVFQIIKLSRAGDLAGLKAFITNQGIKYLFIDPAYLLLFAGDSNGRQASNLFDVGSLLWPLTEIGQETGCTIILLHHTNKSAGRDGSSIGLGDLSFAGFGEWARQWLILSRLSEYEPGSGMHQLSLEVGGSAGHSGRWAVTVDESRNENGDRTYAVDVKSISHHISDEQEQERLRRAERDLAKAEEFAGEVVKALRKRFPDGATRNALRQWVSLSGTKINQAIDYLLDAGILIEFEITKTGRTYPAYKLNPEHRTTPDSTGQTPDQSGGREHRTTGPHTCKGVSGVRSTALRRLDQSKPHHQSGPALEWQTPSNNGATEQALDF